MVRITFLFVFIVSVLSVQSVYGQGFVAPASGNAAIYFVRVSSFGGTTSFEYFEDSKFIGIFKRKNYMRFEVPAGKHLLWASSEDKEFLECDLAAGETYMVLVNVEMGAWKYRVGLEPLTADNEDFERAKELVNSRAPIITPQGVLDKTQAKLENRGFFENIMERYESEWKNSKHTRIISKEMFIPKDKL